jgi:signal transduction histidine kinase
MRSLVKLSSFIQSHMEVILAEWDAFARAHEPVDADMSDEALRDHARTMLQDIAGEMLTAQTEQERQRKSEGKEPRVTEAESAATLHGRERHSNNFTLATLGGEFRALRATVLRLWQPHMERADASALEEVIRFNEGIDKALADSIGAWSERTSHARELFLAILGHDLRSPLASVALAGDMLAQPGVSVEKTNRLALNVTRATRVMSSMINDLTGYASTQLGGSMPHHPEACDLLPALREAIEDATATYPDARFQLYAPGALVGCYDRTRLYQMFLNLLVNAARYGKDGCPVVAEAGNGPGEYWVTITNQGEPIPATSLDSIFKPLVQLENGNGHAARPRTSLGLGLYIARTIAERHGGSIAVTSSEAEGTRFRVSLPGASEEGSAAS